MADAQFFPTNVQRPNDSPLTFQTPEELLTWIEKEQAFWVWLNPTSPSQVGVNDFAKRNEWLNTLKHARNQLNEFIQNPAGDSPLNSALTNLKNYTARDLVSDSARGKYVEGLRAQPEGDVIATAALAVYLGETELPKPAQIPANFRYAVARGRAAMPLFDAMLPSGAMEQAAAAIQRISDANNKALQELKETNATALDELGVLSKRLQEEFSAEQVKRNEQTATELTKLVEEKVKVVEECQRTRDFYTTAMEIAAPVDYWNKKADKHKIAARWWGAALAIYAVLGSWALYELFNFAYARAYELTSAPEDKYGRLIILLTAAVAAGTTIAFWIARFLQRLYLSERHMAIDAKLRETMAMTFLALSAKQQVSADDRSLVLSPLFRPGSDGIIQDEGGLDSAVSMLARALERR